jgi:hypothetical protein
MTIVAASVAVIVFVFSVLYINSDNKASTEKNEVTSKTVQKNDKNEPVFFSDLKKDAWYYNDVCNLVSKGVIPHADTFNGDST